MITIRIALGIMVVIFMAVPVKHGLGQQQETGFIRNYNPNTETTLTGEVTKIEKIRWGRTMNYGIHIIINGERTVHLGPSWYINEQDVQVIEGDQVEVLGSEVDFDGEKVIIARRIEKDGQTLLLRNEYGIPRWSRGRMNRQL
jgi:hypothetical protein